MRPEGLAGACLDRLAPKRLPQAEAVACRGSGLVGAARSRREVMPGTELSGRPSRDFCPGLLHLGAQLSRSRPSSEARTLDGAACIYSPPGRVRRFMPPSRAVGDVMHIGPCLLDLVWGGVGGGY